MATPQGRANLSFRQNQRTYLGNFDISRDTHKATKAENHPTGEKRSISKWKRFLTWHKDDGEKAKERDVAGRFRALFTEPLGIDDGDILWEPERPLGRGGFGVVGLFRKEDQNGQILDQVVVKTALAQKHLAIGQSHPSISQEAATMAQLNSANCDSILFLRNFKHYEEQEEWRYFFEYCPFGDLERIRYKYIAWYEYLPESFLWWVFIRLTDSLQVFETGPPSRSFYNTPNTFLLHNDLKPSNVFLGYEAEFVARECVPRYTVPKMADFGLANITSIRTKNNLPFKFYKGTREYLAPEIRYNRLDPDSAWIPFEARDSQLRWEDLPGSFAKDPAAPKHAHRIGPEANTWAVGVIMWELLTLGPVKVLSKRVDDILCERMPYYGDGAIYPALSTNKSKIIGDEEYSLSLRRLILACLNIYPQKRPSITVLRASVAHYTSQYFDKLTQKHGNDADAWRRATKKYYKENEINQMPAGVHDFKLVKNFQAEFEYRAMFDDPDWGTLKRPQRPRDPDERLSRGSAATGSKLSHSARYRSRSPERSSDSNVSVAPNNGRRRAGRSARSRAPSLSTGRAADNPGPRPQLQSGFVATIRQPAPQVDSSEFGVAQPRFAPEPAEKTKGGAMALDGADDGPLVRRSLRPVQATTKVPTETAAQELERLRALVHDTDGPEFFLRGSTERPGPDVMSWEAAGDAMSWEGAETGDWLRPGAKRRKIGNKEGHAGRGSKVVKGKEEANEKGGKTRKRRN